ncbi:hypothetical protein TNCV_4948701 [Trichonephila clavipes]|nr:hypothetical protein TNCV_4948701 [Trichonephila clavipes]
MRYGHEQRHAEIFFMGTTLIQKEPCIHVPTDDCVSRVFIESSAFNQVFAVHSGMATECAGLVSSQAKPVETYSSESCPVAIGECGPQRQFSPGDSGLDP